MKVSRRYRYIDIYIHIHTDTYTCVSVYMDTYIYHIYHISFLREKRLRATCETWPHKRKIFHLKSKRRPKSCQILPAKCCCHHHSQGPPQESICAAAKGPQVTQQEPPACQKSHVTTSGGCTQGRVGSAAQPKAAVQSQSRALARFPNPPSLELGWVTAPPNWVSQATAPTAHRGKQHLGVTWAPGRFIKRSCKSEEV